MSTNALTARYCKLKDWPSQTVQSYWGRRRHDLFGIIDTVVLHPQGIIWVQNASYGSLAKHKRKIDDCPYLPKLVRQGVWIELWEWRRKKVGRKKLWFRRSQARAYGVWGEVSDWEGPLSL